MSQKKLYIYNSLTGSKEKFKSLRNNSVGMYVCGPTVYSDVHLGNCRTFISFDVIYRYLKHLGYNVRYVRNITDVGHLEDTGEDKISKKAKIEQLEPMEIAQKYTNSFREILKKFNVLDPSIEPTASGHITEQILIIEDLIQKNLAYISNGSVYFDISNYNEIDSYGKLSGRDLDNIKSNSRDLVSQDDKKNEFDIHGGGIDLKFPHHDCEIAQCVGHTGKQPAKFWMHANMLTLNNKKMSKSTGNNILPNELFSGNNEQFSKPYDPNIVRFFFLQANYRSELDISESAIQASEKGFNRLIDIINRLSLVNTVKTKNDKLLDTIKKWENNCYDCLNDDFNTPMLLAEIFNSNKIINDIENDVTKISQVEKDYFINLFDIFLNKILGLNFKKDKINNDSVLEILLKLRDNARKHKDYKLSDSIRDELAKIGINLNDKD